MAKHRRHRPAAAGSLLQQEVGTIRKDAPLRFVLVYPSPYRVAMSSLGYQALYGLLNAIPGACCERAVLESPDSDELLRTIETGRAVNDNLVVGLSVATESEVALAARALMASGIPPLESERRTRRSPRGDSEFPLIVAGGPLTYADGSPLCALADVVLSGESEDALQGLAEILLRDVTFDEALEQAARLPGAAVPAVTGNRTAGYCALADKKWLPATSVITTPLAEFGDMFLIEPARGCPRRCAFCVMEPSKYRTVPAKEVLARIPDHARRVGLVGSALGAHPQLRALMRDLVESGRQVSWSSMRADRLDSELVSLLAQGGTRTLTVAADGASERLRQLVHKRITADHLLRATELAAAGGLRSVKLYAMVGLPTETDADILELCALADEMAETLPVSLAVSPFVPKARTSLAAAAFGPTSVIRQRLALIRKTVAGRVELRAASVRGAWIENAVARGGFDAGVAAVDVAREGCTYAAWKRAAAQHELLAAGRSEKTHEI